MLTNHWTVRVWLTGALLGAACVPASAQRPVRFLRPVAVDATARAAAPTLARRRLSLPEAQALALTNNKSLNLARLNVAEKKLGATAASKDYLPKILGSVTYFHFDRNLGDIVVGAPGKRGILAPGTPLVNTAVVNQNAALSTVFVAQPITKLIAVNAAVQAARADAGAAQAQLDKGARDVASGVAQAYHGLLGARRIEAALELQVKLLAQLSAAAPAPELRIGLIEAKQGLAQVRGQARELHELLLSLLDLPTCTELELVDPVPEELPVRCADDAAQRALVHSPEVREAEQSIAKAEAALKIAKMDYLPDVSVVGGVANQTAANYIQDNVGYFGLTANYMFWGWGKRRDVKRQRETLVGLAHQNLLVARDKAVQEARKAYLTYEQAREAHQLAVEMVAARAEAERKAVGQAVARAKADTARAELEAMKAEISYRVAHAQLHALLGGP